MMAKSAGTTVVTRISWTGRFLDTLRLELHSLHVKEQDRAFLATTKGMSYTPPGESYYDDTAGQYRH